jgi:surface antigen
MNGATLLDRVTFDVKGDANGDGKVDISDYTALRLHILRLKMLSGTNAQMADVNGDGAIDISDYTIIRLYLLGLRDIG